MKSTTSLRQRPDDPRELGRLLVLVLLLLDAAGLLDRGRQPGLPGLLLLILVLALSKPVQTTKSFAMLSPQHKIN